MILLQDTGDYTAAEAGALFGIQKAASIHAISGHSWRDIAKATKEFVREQHRLRDNPDALLDLLNTENTDG